MIGGSFRSRLWTIIGLTVAAMGTMAIVDMVGQAAVEQQLDAIEEEYLPLIRLGPEVDAMFNRLVRAMQDAVAAHDLEAIEDTRALRDALVRRMERAPPSVDREAVAEARRRVLEWYDLLYDVSVRLMREETGEALVADIGRMQVAQRGAADALRRTFSFDRRHLVAAFAEARDQLRTAAWLRMGIRLALMSLVILVTVGFVRRATRGLAALEAGFDRFGSGRLNEPVPLADKDELGVLAAHANRMAARFDELSEGLRRKQGQLERMNEELEAFSYSVSHDLRAPLRAMDGFSQAVLEDYGDRLDAEGRDDLQRIRAAAQHMGRLIEDMLKLSRVTRAELRHEPVDLAQMAREIATSLRAAAPERDVTFHIPDRLVVEGDGSLLRLALDNLLGNAWKFTSKVSPACIELGGTRHADEVIFFVRDNGAGFDMAFADNLFGAFQRLHTTQEFPGTGIGLATVRRVAHRHEGRTWAEGTVGKGATFYVALPQKASTT